MRRATPAWQLFRYQSARAAGAKHRAAQLCGVRLHGSRWTAGVAPSRRRDGRTRDLRFPERGWRSIGSAFARDPRIAALNWERPAIRD